MRRPHLGLSIAAALAAFGAIASVASSCGGGGAQEAAVVPPTGAYRGSEPPAGIAMPDFALHDVVTGKRIDSGELSGKVVLITFIDTDCHEQCPLIASAVADALRLLPASIRLKTSALAVSVNPLIDTRMNVRRFLRQRHAQAITYLTGSVAELKRVWKRFGVVSAYETGDADTHSADVRVFDPGGGWVSTQHSGVDLTPTNLADDVQRAMEG
jgi:protein SCO1/2